MATPRGAVDRFMDTAENVVGGLERAFGRGAQIAAKAGSAAAKAGGQMIATGEKLAALAPGAVPAEIQILDVIEDGRPAFLVKYGAHVASCNTREFAELIKAALCKVTK